MAHPTAGRRGGDISEGSRAAINAFLYRTGALGRHLPVHAGRIMGAVQGGTHECTWLSCSARVHARSFSCGAQLPGPGHPARLGASHGVGECSSDPRAHVHVHAPPILLPMSGPRAHAPPLCLPAGEQSRDFCVVLATNRPSDLDPAVIDRTDEAIEFGLPGRDER